MRDDFLAQLASPWQEEAAALPDLDERLTKLLHDAKAAHPTLAIDGAPFVGHIATLCSVSPPRQGLGAWLAKLHAEEVYLAYGCGLSLEPALSAFESQYKGLLIQKASGFVSHRHDLDDLLQILREKLFVTNAERAPRLLAYAGQGPLAAWLRITATRTFLDVARGHAQHKREFGEQDERIAEAPDAQGDFELQFLKAEYRGHFKAAFTEAFATLDSGQRNLLRQQVLFGLSIDQIGAMFQMHRSTAARRIAKARDTLLDQTRRLLLQRLKISREEFDSLMLLAQSHLDLSLQRLLLAS